jgi:hypothetical protein
MVESLGWWRGEEVGVCSFVENVVGRIAEV